MNGAPMNGAHTVAPRMSDTPAFAAKMALDALAQARGTKNTVFTVSGYGLTLSVQEHSALANVILGSVGNGVLARCKLPVLLVR